MHLMKAILGLTNDLSQALQRKYQGIVNAMNFVKICEVRLQSMRESSWNSLLDEVSNFYNTHDILMLKMDVVFLVQWRQRQKSQETTNMHHYRVEVFQTIIDMQLQKLNTHFIKKSIELFLCVVCLCPSNSFATNFDEKILICLAQFYILEIFQLLNLLFLNISFKITLLS